MTTEEAIKVLNELDEITLYKKEAEALEKGIEAIKRTIPKEVLYSYDGYFNGEPVVDMASCPNCGHDFEQGDETWESKFCNMKYYLCFHFTSIFFNVDIS